MNIATFLTRCYASASIQPIETQKGKELGVQLGLTPSEGIVATNHTGQFSIIERNTHRRTASISLLLLRDSIVECCEYEEPKEG